MKMKAYVRPEALYPYQAWSLAEEAYDDENNQRSESVFALGNGYIGMRGNFEEGYHGVKGTSVTGNYINGFYDAKPIHYPEGAYGYPSRNQAMLNVTNAQCVGISVGDEPFHLNTGQVLSFSRELDMKRGFLKRQIEWEAPSGGRVRISFHRLVSFTHKHLAVVQVEVESTGFEGEITLHSFLDGKIQEAEATDDPRLGSGGGEPSLMLEKMEQRGELSLLKQRTRHTGFELITGISHRIEAPAAAAAESVTGEEQIGTRFTLKLSPGEKAVLTKYISYHTSKDGSNQEAELEKRAEGTHREASLLGFSRLMDGQQAYLDSFWQHADVEIEGDPALQQGIRFNAFQLLQSVGRDGLTNIGAKGLTGEGYEGHYFWDTEMYMMPFFTYTQPDIARALMDFRYATLDKARSRAQVMSQKGALYPWRTIDGDENSAYFPAGTAQMHINADIAYAIKQYVQATGDIRFLLDKGAEILFETSRFWVDLGHFNEARGGAFCIDGVTGPDEYTAIVNNNTYTNLMVQSQLNYACDTAELLGREHPEVYERLRQSIGLTQDEVAGWREAAARMFVPYDETLGIYAQDDTFLTKKKWDFEHTPEDQYPLLLHFHPLVIYRHQVLKQADTVMALFLLSEKFTMEEKIRNYQYYEPLTTHDSSLSPCIHSIVSAEIGDLDGAYAYFDRTVRMDLDDINRNAKDGLHTAAMAGSWMSIVHGFAGMRLTDGELAFSPALPHLWQSCTFRVTYHGQLLMVRMGREETRYTLVQGDGLTFKHKGRELSLAAGETIAVD
ncbi:glycoside hydrolase family 65 protein [Paenibacillus chibensis]|uniref:glycoside hydrolase family 65 protein n=1 Tax=Paenibacillus chibensis TaxID=59846 RepID=UPI000FDBFBEF|nr:glycosyl hydrolase family 65 protein [Paenibacillus chibensis]MEC0369019.1 glycosyl hydrolase family 65 protein [Paenibacillus chibensis]